MQKRKQLEQYYPVLTKKLSSSKITKENNKIIINESKIINSQDNKEKNSINNSFHNRIDVY